MRTRLVASLVTGLMLAGGALGLAAQPAAGAGATGVPNFDVGSVRLTGAAEVPGPGDEDGRGRFSYVAFGDHLCYVLTAFRIEPATMAHIHSGAADVAGPIAINLTAPTRGFSADCIEAVDNSTPDSAAVLLRSELDAIIATPENFYANVHNAAFQAGAIRGQLA
ncbi:MAG TPA: CHRD domain-containing protein [Acidimicrobiales bacterium]